MTGKNRASRRGGVIRLWAKTQMDAYFRASRAALMAAGRNKLALAHAMVPTKQIKEKTQSSYRAVKSGESIHIPSQEVFASPNNIRVPGM